MRKFNQTINIEVSVDAIANQLLNTINPNVSHREQLVEAIISTAVDHRDALAHIYNAMHGSTPEVKFKVGDILNCKSNVYMYLTEESRTKRDSQRSPVGKCIVVDVNPYKSESICVEYDYYNLDGSVKRETKWVYQEECQPFVQITVQEDIFN